MKSKSKLSKLFSREIFQILGKRVVEGVNNNSSNLNITFGIPSYRGRVWISARPIGFIFSKKAYSGFKFWPKKAKDSNAFSNNGSRIDNIALVIQGPMVTKDNFTIETLRLYRKMFVSAPIILCTWKAVSKIHKDTLSQLKIDLIEEDDIADPGFGNVNRQVFLTSLGVKKAKELGCEYVMKSRTDCRIYNPRTLEYLISLWRSFPGSNGGSRIIASNLATCRHRIYGITDMFVAGKTDDMLSYWDRTSWEESLQEYFGGKKIINGTPVICEIFLCARYLVKQGKKLEWSTSDWMQNLKDYFVIVDVDMIDLIFMKYEHHTTQRFSSDFVHKQPRGLNFIDWLNIYSNTVEDFGVLSGDFDHETWKHNTDGSFTPIYR